jgi:class 3 adenylate cyclase
MKATMYTDQVKSTPKAQTDEEFAEDLRKKFMRLTGPIIEKHRGTILSDPNTTGDRYVAQFDANLDAVQCAYNIQMETHRFNEAFQAGKMLALRTGIHSGDVIIDSGGSHGDNLNKGSRLESYAGEDGGVVISLPVYMDIENKLEIDFVSLGNKIVKGVEKPMELYRMVLPWESQAIGQEKTTVIEFSNRFLENMRSVVDIRRTGLRSDLERIQECVEKYPEAIPVERYDEESGNEFAKMLLDGLDTGKSIMTMWTLGLGEKLFDSYITRVLPKEQEVIKRGTPIVRIVSHLSILDTLKYIALHAQTFREPGRTSYHLFLPRIRKHVSTSGEVLLSSQLCPEVEIVVVGNEKASVDVKGEFMNQRTHVETSNELRAGVYQTLIKWFTRDSASAIDNKDALVKWLQRLDSELHRLGVRQNAKPRTEREDLSRERNLIRAIYQALGPDKSLNEAWWNKTAPIYTQDFTSVENSFLQCFFLEEAVAVRQVLQHAQESKTEPPVYIEVGSGAGRTFQNLLGKTNGVPVQNPPFAAFVGIDFSSEMVSQCEKSLIALYKSGLDRSLWKVPWALVQGDARSFVSLLDGRARQLRRLTGLRGERTKVDEILRSHPWVIGLTSILPNVNASDKRLMLSSIRNTANKNDFVFASSYHGGHFGNVAYQLYTNPKVTGISGATVVTYDLVRHVYSSVDERTGRFFTTHWSTPDDLIKDFSDARLRAQEVRLPSKPDTVREEEDRYATANGILERAPYPRGAFVECKILVGRS